MNRCEKCNRALRPDNTIWLELSITDGKYYYKLPKGHESQGAFPFGPDCAYSILKPNKSK